MEPEGSLPWARTNQLTTSMIQLEAYETHKQNCNNYFLLKQVGFWVLNR
jgi:coproporphyrinogen III oxidase